MKNGYIRSVILNRTQICDFECYPFAIPAIRNLSELPLNRCVTFFCGENGTGKSTLTEAIAVAFGLNGEGGSRNFTFSTYQSHSALSAHLTLVKGTVRPRDAYFLRAESFYNVATNMEHLDAQPAAAPPIKASYGGKSLHDRSHGESFFALFSNRFSGNGLYILDEPEAALSPQAQLAMLYKIHELQQNNSQLIIATHSPILLSYPESTIYRFTENGIAETAYEDTENYQITKNFLNDYKRQLSYLLN